MTGAMGPPPPRNPSDDVRITTPDTREETDNGPSPSEPTKSFMGPPPSKNPSSLERHSDVLPPVEDEIRLISATESDGVAGNSKSIAEEKGAEKRRDRGPSVSVPYTIPPWSDPPCHRYFLEVLKDGAIIDQLNVNEKGAYMFGRVDLCDFMLEHPTISRFHAVLQFKSSGDAYLYDLGSTHGTFVNKSQVQKRVYIELHVGDVLRFGLSSRLYIFQGPADLMPLERDLKSIREAKVRQDMQDMEASLLRAKLEASRADGISWGMREDAVEENEDEIDEITWQTYKGQLTEKQEKTREKVIKRLEKIAHMKKEIDAIRAKDIPQGGLTQGQQTQIARNEQRISQIMEELENLEETLNESIRESVGARAGRVSHGKRKGLTEGDEEEYLSDDDEFYDRTKKTAKQKPDENQSIETAESLLEKKDAIVKEMDEKRKLIADDNSEITQEKEIEVGDALDAYMTGLSSQLAVEKMEHVHKEISALQSELDRILYLLKIADPTGEAVHRRELKLQEPSTKCDKASSSIVSKLSASESHQGHGVDLSSKGPGDKQVPANTSNASSKLPEEQNESLTNAAQDGQLVYTLPKPQWLGAVEDNRKEETNSKTELDVQESDQFVDYKDRDMILRKSDASGSDELGIENAAPGLILRKRKQVQESERTEVKSSDPSLGAGIMAEDAVALLLKHSKGLYSADNNEAEDIPHENQIGKEKRPKRVLGPERPSFLKKELDYETWMPPEGQSGDGRTSLNDRFGY